MPSKSIFRRPGVKHFQLVHRSQRDPLINDPEASAHVLKPIEKRGKSRADLESTLTPEEISAHSNIGEASLYGIYYDDTEYDYMQHLRPVGLQEDGVESVLIEAPMASKQRQKTQPKSGNKIDSLELPEGVLASTHELPRNFESEQPIPDSISGFQPDMDNHLRQVLEALDDDAYVDDDLDDDFFKELVAEGEKGADEEVYFEFREEGIEDSEESSNIDESWEKRFAAFKKAQKDDDFSTDDGHSEGADTVGFLSTISVLGGKKRRRKGCSVVSSGYSMSSSSMYRNEALETLDERFDQIMIKEYVEGHDEEDLSEDENQADGTPELITSRDDFDSMVDQFLNDYEILGRRMKPKLEGETGPEKLRALRQAMAEDQKIRIDPYIDDDEALDSELCSAEDKNDTWDCETILTTYTNLENHPRLIRARDSKPVPKIQLDYRTGLPSIPSSISQQVTSSTQPKKSERSEEEIAAHKTVTRPRNETKEEKQARKTAVKQEKQARRTERKATKEQFTATFRDQKKKLENKGQRLKQL